jgi:hypothetical protein
MFQMKEISKSVREDGHIFIFFFPLSDIFRIFNINVIQGETMKTKLSQAVAVLIAVLCGTAVLSCASGSGKVSDMEPINLAGTKWVGVLPFFGFWNTLEFVDETNCIYTLLTGPREYTYKIKGNKLYFGRDTYEIRGDKIYYRGNPHFVTEEYFNNFYSSVDQSPPSTDDSQPEN